MSGVNLTVSQQTYQLLLQRAGATQRTPSELADELLRARILPTDHPYVVRRPGFRGGRPILRGSSIPVWLVVAMWKAGDSLEEIGETYPHLEPAAIYDAISYYLDHQAEIEDEIAENDCQKPGFSDPIPLYQLNLTTSQDNETGHNSAG